MSLGQQVKDVADALYTLSNMDLELSNKELTKMLIKFAPALLALEARVLILENKLMKDSPN